MKSDWIKISVNKYENVPSLWHENCRLCKKFLLYSKEDIINMDVLSIQYWYDAAQKRLSYVFEERCARKCIEFPGFYPGRHWIKQLQELWMRLYPDTDSSNHDQVCEDLRSLLNFHPVFSDSASTTIEELKIYLVDNVETVRNIFIRIFEKMNESDENLDKIRGGTVKETPEDGSYIYFIGTRPRFVVFGVLQETQLQRDLRRFSATSLVHFPCQIEDSDVDR